MNSCGLKSPELRQTGTLLGRTSGRCPAVLGEEEIAGFPSQKGGGEGGHSGRELCLQASGAPAGMGLRQHHWFNS